MKSFHLRIIYVIIFVLVLYTLWFCYSRSVNRNLNCIHESIDFQFDYVVRIELVPDVFNCYQNLLDKKSVKTFIKLEESLNPVARAYGVWGQVNLLDTPLQKATFLKSRIGQMDSVTVRYSDLNYATNLGALYFDLACENLDKFVIDELKLEIRNKNYNHIDTLRNE